MFLLWRHIAVAAVLPVFVTLAPAGDLNAANAQPRAAHAHQIQPDPGYGPGEVIRLLLEALAHNDAPYQDAGIKTVYRFASPANKRLTGPLAHFTLMLHGPAYGPMLDYVAVEYGPLEVGVRRAQQPVIVTSSAGKRIGYIFELSRQTAAPFKGAWMTDGVTRVEVPQDLRQA